MLLMSDIEDDAPKAAFYTTKALVRAKHSYPDRA